jgi:uncharacterized protein YjlB
MNDSPVLTPSTFEGLPSQNKLDSELRSMGLAPAWWSNRPGDRYQPHSHGYHKVLFCARGSIRFVIEPSGETFDLTPGDRLDIPTGTTHSAIVGPEGVTCVEAARR